MVSMQFNILLITFLLAAFVFIFYKFIKIAESIKSNTEYFRLSEYKKLVDLIENYKIDYNKVVLQLEKFKTENELYSKTNSTEGRHLGLELELAKAELEKYKNLEAELYDVKSKLENYRDIEEFCNEKEVENEDLRALLDKKNVNYANCLNELNLESRTVRELQTKNESLHRSLSLEKDAKISLKIQLDQAATDIKMLQNREEKDREEIIRLNKIITQQKEELNKHESMSEKYIKHNGKVVIINEKEAEYILKNLKGETPYSIYITRSIMEQLRQININKNNERLTGNLSLGWKICNACDKKIEFCTCSS